MEGNTNPQVIKLEEKIKSVNLPPDLSERLSTMIERLRVIQKESSFITEYDNISRYIEWIVSLPWDKSSKDILDLNFTTQVLNKNHYGLKEVKDRILEYLSVMILKEKENVKDSFSRAPIISLVGLVGTGKTTIAYSIAEAMGRKIERIPFGGIGGNALLRGQSRVFGDSEPGYIIKALRRAETNNPVILLDEIDRVSENSRTDIMGVLLELLDPEQNKNFMDHFIDYPFDLSNVIFIATSNNTKDISTAVLDRLEVIQMPSYTDEEKTAIAKSFMFPQILKESGLSTSDLIIDDNVWETIIRPLGYDPGMRSLQRTIQGLARKIARYIVEGKLKQGGAYRITTENVKDFFSQW